MASAEPDRYDLSSLGVSVYGWAAMAPALSASLTALCDGTPHFGPDPGAGAAAQRLPLGVDHR